MLQDKISKDYIQAMKAKDSQTSGALSFLRAQLKNIIIEKRVEQLSDEEVISVIKKQVKQRQDSIEQFKQGGRKDLVGKEEAELAILKQYLPEEMPEAELVKIIEETIAETNASSMKDMGSVMKSVGAKTAGRADNKRLSQLIKDALMNK